MFKQIINDYEINEYIKYSDECLNNMGFTEHGFAHVNKVAHTVEYILSEFGFDEGTIELGKIAGYMHDIGNCVNRHNHSHSGAIIARQLLYNMGMSIQDISKIMYAIGNHDESDGTPADPISAALVLADKADIRRSRVRKEDISSFDIHDKVNYSVISANFSIDHSKKCFILDIQLNTQYGTALDYYEIFLSRMLFCKKAANIFGYNFSIQVEECEKL